MLTHDEFVRDLMALPPGTELRFRDDHGRVYRGILLAPDTSAADTMQLMLATAHQASYYFELSPALQVWEVRMQEPATASEVLTGGLMGMMGGAVLGAYLGEALKSETDDSGAPRFIGGMSGALAGFAAGAVIVPALRPERILKLQDKVPP